VATITKFTNYEAFAEALQRTCVISDPWIEGRERFHLEPVLLTTDTYARLCTAAESIGALYDELCEIVWERPALLDEFFCLTPYQKLMWLNAGGRWHGIARLDMFLLADGQIQCCEMNSDTPSGEAEAVLLNELLFEDEDEEGEEGQNWTNPNAGFASRFSAMLWNFYRASVDAPRLQPAKPRLAVIYPTEMTEDLSMITMYHQWLHDAGFAVVDGSPYNLHLLPADSVEPQSAAMFGERIDIAFRHYKTDWWGEREPVWRDADGYPDPASLVKPLDTLFAAEAAGTLAVVNPLGAVLTQNKHTMAFCWQYLSLFSEKAQTTVRTYIPQTTRFADVPDPLALDKNDWVLKSDYGCEGDEVIIGRFATAEHWQTCLQMAVPKRWILQKFFEAAPLDTSTTLVPNYGIYLLGGSASGIYTRLSSAMTDNKAVSAATFVAR
jgi:glutathionylspermidine synthase